MSLIYIIVLLLYFHIPALIYYFKCSSYSMLFIYEMVDYEYASFYTRLRMICSHIVGLCMSSKKCMNIANFDLFEDVIYSQVGP